MRLAAGTFTILLAITAACAVAQTLAPVETTCPIGGETFDVMPALPTSITGGRPDGKPTGSGPFPPDLAICPGNGLVIFQKSFSADDQAALEKLIAEPDYKAMAQSDTSYYRAAWLMRRLDRDPVEIADMILQASWQADDRPLLKRRYQAEFAAVADPLVKAGGEDPMMLLAGRTANAHRELGQFEAAGAILDGLPIASLATLIPAEERDGDTVTNQDAIDAARAQRALLSYLTGLKDLVSARNPMPEPLSLLPVAIVVERCAAVTTLSDDDRAYCASDDLKKAIAATR